MGLIVWSEIEINRFQALKIQPRPFPYFFRPQIARKLFFFSSDRFQTIMNFFNFLKLFLKDSALVY